MRDRRTSSMPRDRNVKPSVPWRVSSGAGLRSGSRVGLDDGVVRVAGSVRSGAASGAVVVGDTVGDTGDTRGVVLAAGTTVAGVEEWGACTEVVSCSPTVSDAGPARLALLPSVQPASAASAANTAIAASTDAGGAFLDPKLSVGGGARNRARDGIRPGRLGRRSRGSSFRHRRCGSRPARNRGRTRWALADDLVAGGVGDEMGETLGWDHAAVAHELGHCVTKGTDPDHPHAPSVSLASGTRGSGERDGRKVYCTLRRSRLGPLRLARSRTHRRPAGLAGRGAFGVARSALGSGRLRTNCADLGKIDASRRATKPVTSTKRNGPTGENPRSARQPPQIRTMAQFIMGVPPCAARPPRGAAASDLTAASSGETG